MALDQPVTMSGIADSREDASRPAAMTGQGRWHAFDHLRGWAMLAGIFLHAFIPFVTHPAAEAWPVVNLERHWVFDLFIGFVHAFRMQLFFLLAGFFAAMLRERRGPRGFLGDRAARVGLPFLAGMATLAPLLWWQWDFQLPLGATVHFWFLQYLLVFYLAAEGLARASRRWSANPHWTGWAGSLVSSWRGSFWLVPSFLLMWWWPIWNEAEYARGATFLPHPAILAAFGLFFAFGWVLYRHHQAGIAYLRRSGPMHLALGLAAWALWVAGMQGWLDSLPAAKLMLRLSGTAMSWFLVLGTIGLCLRLLDRSSPFARYLAGSSYWMYWAHLPLVIALQAWIIPMHPPLWIKALLIIGLTLAFLLASYHLLVRDTPLGRMFNGPRRAPP